MNQNLLLQPGTERYILLPEHQRDAPLPRERVSSLPGLFEAKVRQCGNAPLLSFCQDEGGKLTTVSYADAYGQSLRLSKALHISLDRPPPGTAVVGIWMEKSIELHLAMFATTLSGAAWLPFDADAPAARVAACLVDSKARVLICDTTHHEQAIEATQGSKETLIVPFETLIQQSNIKLQAMSADSPSQPQPHHAAYLIYTSGSTGTPKGIEISHRAALTFSLSEHSILGTNAQDVVWQGFSAAFDMFIEEVWVSIAGGAQLAVGSRTECRDVPALGGASGVWARRGVTVVNAVPTLVNIMTSLDEVSGIPPSVRILNLGGEACPPALVKKLWRPDLRIVNTYGPSEATVTATYQDLLPNDQVTIGKPLPSYHALLLSIPSETELFHSSPLLLRAGVEGELAIGGPCLANGYIGRPELTAAKFVAHPFVEAGSSADRVYRTGDRVRLDENYNLVFCGRIDTQVKHRGFRIELGEIESALASHPLVHTAAVILSTEKRRLEAYVVVQEGSRLAKEDLRSVLRHLPSYMQPEATFFVTSEEMPRLPSGKINAHALQIVSKELADEEKLLQPPRSNHAVEDRHIDDTSDLGIFLRNLSKIFPQAGTIAPDSDFFDDLGGHSLTAATLVSRLRKDALGDSCFGTIGMQDVYLGRTPREIVSRVAGRVDDSNESTDDIKKMREMPSANLEALAKETHLPVSRMRYFFCGMAQIPALFLVWSLQSILLLLPYIVFYIVLGARGLGEAIGTAYCLFVVMGPIMTAIGIGGKWIVLGRAKRGEYPLYGTYYYRWWLAARLVSFIDLGSASNTPFYGVLMRAVGARVGNGCHIGSISVNAEFDLVELGDHATVGLDVHLATSVVERGLLCLRAVHIGSHTHIGSNSVLEGGSRVEEGGELQAMSMLPNGHRVPHGQCFYGSPARFKNTVNDIGNMSRSPPNEMDFAMSTMAMFFSIVFVFPIIGFAAQIPSLYLFDVLDLPHLGAWATTGVIAVPAALAYLILVFVELVALRWIILGRLKEGTHSIASLTYFRKWFVDRLMDMSLVILHPVYATLYVAPFLRSLGVKIGRNAEISTARGINFELTQIGDESFVADAVMFGDAEVRNSAITFKKTLLESRAFAGNASLLPQGTRLASNTLVGVLSIAPPITSPLKEGQSCFGSPPVLMPARQGATTCHLEHLLYSPRWTQIAMRLIIESMRIILPRILLVYGLGIGLKVFDTAYTSIGIIQTLCLLPFFHLFLFAFPALLFVVATKWLLIGRYKVTEWPLWSIQVWLSEFVTSTYETLLAPVLTDTLVGTPYLAWVFRMLGVQIGARATLLSNDITEYDLVAIGDEAVLNAHAGPQTHLFEDRIMKLGRVDLEARACIKPYSICLPNSRIAEEAQLGCLSLVMKGETVPAFQAWEGAPIAPQRRQQMQQDRESPSKATCGDEKTSTVSWPISKLDALHERAGRSQATSTASSSRQVSPGFRMS